MSNMYGSTVSHLKSISHCCEVIQSVPQVSMVGCIVFETNRLLFGFRSWFFGRILDTPTCSSRRDSPASTATNDPGLSR